MKKLVGILAVLVGMTALPVKAADLSFPSYHADITIGQDASIQVAETIQADMTSPLHGIYRTIPFRYTTTSGGTASIPIHIDTIVQDGRSAEWSQSTANGNLKLKIGDPNKTITGSHTYTINYTASAATNFFSDHDELYWNVTGDQWDAPLSAISATITLPATFATESVRTTCYTGVTGSKDQNCKLAHTGTSATFSADEFLTVVVGWPVGAVTKPANYDARRSQGTISISVGLSGWPLVANILLPMLALGFMVRRWWTHGRDPAGKRTIVAQYDPPDDLRPAELDAVMNERASRRDLSATIVDLAVRGYLKIIENVKPRALGLGHERDYVLRLLKQPDGNCRDYEKTLIGVLFETETTPADGQPELRWTDLKKRKYTTNPFAPILKQITDGVSKAGYFVGNPTSVRLRYFIIGGAVAVGGFLATMLLSTNLFGLYVAGAIIAAIGWFLPQRTLKGVEAAWVGHGFKLFLEKAEQYRLQWQERENIFEQFLPYAMVLDVADKWTKALAPMVNTSPTWYEGQPGSAFNAMILYSSLSSFSTSVSSFAVSSAASGSSGFSGGSSGGGGGGGGGGGW